MQSFFDDNSQNTWVFTGGSNTCGDFFQTYGARNFVGHFEEYIRWQITDENKVKTLERFTINTAKNGQSLKDVEYNFDSLVSVYSPKFVCIMVGTEDYLNEISYIDTFKNCIASIYKKVKEIDAILILQTPVPNISADKNIYAYINIIKEFENLYSDLIVVDNFKMCSDLGIKFKDGKLDQNGHIEIAKQLIEVLFKSNAEFKLNEIISKTNLDIPSLNIDSNSYKVQNLMNKKNKIRWLFIGDSITHGAYHTKGYDSVAQLFEKYIHTIGRTDDVIINTGVSGSTTKDFLDNIEARYIKYKNLADVVFVMFGANDSVKLTLNEFKINLKSILDLIDKNNSIAILRTPTPCMEDKERNKNIPKCVQSIKEYAFERKYILIDHYTQWMDVSIKYPNILKSGGWISYGDRIHPSANGHINMFKSILQRFDMYDKNLPLFKFEYKIRL